MTQLIRHTIEFMQTRKYGQAVLNIDSETKENVKSIVEHTPLYNRGERKSVVSRCLRMRAHPYYTEYGPLQKLCLQILRMEEVKYGESADEIYGILFDGAWLWEEYVNTILGGLGFAHPENKLKSGAIFLFDDHSGKRYPDFYDNEIVLDAKYKPLGCYNKVSDVDKDDVHQVMAYMTALELSKGGFVAPLEQKQEKVPTARLVHSTATLSIFGVEISKSATSYADFCEAMKENEHDFVKSLDRTKP